MKRFGIFVLSALSLAACAHLGALANIQAPTIQAADSRNAQIQLLGPSGQNPLGGVQLRLFAHVSNPNPMALTLTRIAGTLALEGTQAANVDFPLGLPLPASGDTIIPLDIRVGFADLPALANIIPQAMTRGTVNYDLEGTFAVDAGVLGQPSFGPTTLMRGIVQTR